jgi:hypothetical protein
VKKITHIDDKDMSQLPRELFALILAHASPCVLVRIAIIAKYNASIGRELEHRPYIFEQRAHSNDRYRKVDNQDFIEPLIEYHGDVGIDRKGSIIFFLPTAWMLPKSVQGLKLQQLVYCNYRCSEEVPECIDFIYIDQQHRLRLFHLYTSNEGNKTHNVVQEVIAYNVQQATVFLMQNQEQKLFKGYLMLNKQGSLLYLCDGKELTLTLPSTIEVLQMKAFIFGAFQFAALLDTSHTLHIYTLPGMVLMQQIKDVLLVINHCTNFAYLTLDNKIQVWNNFGTLTFDTEAVRVPFLNGYLFFRQYEKIRALAPCQLLEEHLDKYRCVNLRFKK